MGKVIWLWKKNFVTVTLAWCQCLCNFQTPVQGLGFLYCMSWADKARSKPGETSSNTKKFDWWAGIFFGDYRKVFTRKYATALGSTGRIHVVLASDRSDNFLQTLLHVLWWCASLFPEIFQRKVSSTGLWNMTFLRLRFKLSTRKTCTHARSSLSTRM